MTFVGRIGRSARRLNNSLRGTTVLYTRESNGASYTITAKPTQSRTSSFTEMGVEVDRQLLDFICEVEDLPFTPERGDVVRWGSRDFMVLHPGGGREWDYHDNDLFSYRIHTVEQQSRTQVQQAAYGSPDGDAYGTPTDEAYGTPE